MGKPSLNLYDELAAFSHAHSPHVAPPINNILSYKQVINSHYLTLAML